MSFWRKAFRKDEEVPPPIQRRPPAAEARGPTAPSATPPPAAEPAPASPPVTAPPPPADRPAGTSTLAAGVTGQGTLTGRGTVRVEGVWQGEVRLDGTLVVAPGGRVEGPAIVARRVVVEGLLRGPVQAEYVEIGATGRVWGDVVTTAFVTREGAFLRGQVRMEERLDLPLSAAEPPPAPAGDVPAPADTAPAPAEPVPPPEEGP